MGRTVRKACKTAREKETLFTRMSCINKVGYQVDMLMANLTHTFMQVLKMSDSKDKLPGVCCLFFRYREDVSKAALKVCPKIDVDYFLSFMDGFSEDTVNLLCAGLVHGSQKCQQAVNKIPTLSQRSLRAKPEFSSFIPPLLLILNSL